MSGKQGVLEGGCRCGAIRFEVRGAPVRMLNCHCRDCQQTTGAGYAPIFVVQEAAFELTGSLRYWATTGGSGQRIERGFCPECGSQVLIRLQRAPEIVAINAASLDDPSAHRPTLDIYTGSRQPWDVLAAETAKFSGDWRQPG